MTVYTTKTCAYCAMVKKFLDMKGVKYDIVDLEDDPAKRQELIAQTGAMTVPITEHNGEFVIGWNPAKLSAIIPA